MKGVWSRAAARLLLCAACASCAGAPHPRTAATSAAEAAAPAPPLEQVCRETLPLRERTVGGLVHLLQRNNTAISVEVRACRAGTAWPIAFATGEREGSRRAPIGYTVLRMEGDALLDITGRRPAPSPGQGPGDDREAPTVKLCHEVLLRVGAGRLVRAVALSDSSEEAALDPARAEASSAPLAWVELLSRAPSGCALGRTEPELPADAIPDWFVDVGSAPADEASAAGVGAAAARHRYAGDGRPAGPEAFGELALERRGPERCLYEPPPATRDVCLSAYRDPSGGLWYGRGDTTRTGVDGDKNYVDSYLTFQLLRRIEAERRAAGGAPPAKK
jgi:hypothetical protein